MSEAQCLAKSLEWERLIASETVTEVRLVGAARFSPQLFASLLIYRDATSSCCLDELCRASNAALRLRKPHR
jgi:hypothetical protein